MPPKIYGSPLPPGLEGNTRGELRIRIDKLLLDDIALNRNPLIRFPLGGNTGVHTGSTAAAVSPNTFVVPVDHCAVSPLFWGEAKPTASCQPATPRQSSRGAITLVYPIKSSSENLADYLVGMSRSPHGGLQLSVYVPSSYSGRPAIPIGKCVIFLDELTTGKTLSGWYSVVHTQPSEAADEEPYEYFTVGKLKVNIQLDMFPGTSGANSASASPHPRSLNQSRGVNESRGSEAAGHHNERHVSQEEDVAPTTSAIKRSLRPAGMNVSFRSDTDASNRHQRQAPHHAKSPNRGTDTSVEINMTGIQDSSRDLSRDDLPASAPSTEAVPRSVGRVNEAKKNSFRSEAATTTEKDPLERDLRRQNADLLVGDLVSRGLQLRERMTRAVDDSLDVLARNHQATAANQDTLPKGDVTAADSRVRFEDEDTGAGEHDDTAFTSEDSVDEEFAVQLQHDKLARELRDKQQRLASVLGRTTTGAALASTATASAAINGEPTDACQPRSAALRSSNGLSASRPMKVELKFSNFSFAVTPATADLKEMRLNVCLSSDISTAEPTAGPFSSYVHPVPLSQPAICLSFHVASYSPETSRIVVELIKVKSTNVRETENGSTVATENMTAVKVGQRHLVAEEQVGLCMVGLYEQRRTVAMRDPVTNTNNAFCDMKLALVHGTEPGSGAFSQDVLHRTPHRGEDPYAVVNMSAGEDDAPYGGRDTSASSRASSSHSSAPSRSSTASTTSSEAAGSKEQPPLQGRRSHRHNRRAHSRKRDHYARDTDVTRSEAVSSTRSLLRKKQHRAAVQVSHYALAPQRFGATPSNGCAVQYCHVRLCVAVQRAVHLPRVLVAPSRGGTHPRAIGGNTPSVLRSLEDAHEGKMNEHDETENNYALPQAFVHVDALLPPTASTARRDANEIPDWSIDSYVNGFYDRTHVAAASQKPFFNYSCVLSVPRVAVPVVGETRRGPREEGVTKPSGGPCSAAEREAIFNHALGELKLTVWHHHPMGEQEDEQAAKDTREEEVRFWSSSARLGECRVDLRPLRFMDSLDGFYCITSQLPAFTQERQATAVQAVPSHDPSGIMSPPMNRLSSLGGPGGVHSIGHIHVSVWLADVQ